MNAVGIAADTPPKLVGSRPPRGASLLARLRARRASAIPGIPDRALDEPIIVARTILGRAVLVSEPAAVKRVLVDNVGNYPKTAMEKRFFVALFGSGLLGAEGETWRRHRRIMAPSFDPRAVAAYGPAISESAGHHLEKWDAGGPAEQVDMAEEMVELTLRIICRTMFSEDAEAMVGHVTGAFAGSQEIVGNLSVLDLIPPFSEGRMRAREARIARIFAPLDAAVERLVAQREADPTGFPQDLLARLVAAKDSEGAARLSAREVRDEIVTIFAAGHETTAVTMSWTWYLLSQHPTIEARLHGELDAVLGGRAARQEDLPDLVYTRRVIEESMRLYPAAPGLSARRALEADELAGRPVRPGDIIAIAPWVLHRHQRLWDDPERFDPDRFSPERSAGRAKFAYLPFAAGPRVCIGHILAMNEAILILASLAQAYAPRLAPDAKVALLHSVTLQPRYGLKMTLERRSKV